MMLNCILAPFVVVNGRGADMKMWGTHHHKLDLGSKC
jgi:hypothetical protein